MITQSRLHELFDYDQHSGLLIRKTTTGSRSIKGSAVGSISHGYLKCCVDSIENQYVHRLVWEYVYGDLGDKAIDHINGNGMDNRIENLRLANKGENGCNESNGFHNAFDIDLIIEDINKP